VTGLYTTGELARISRTTVRTLRYYDEIGILKPARVSDGGHRYYDEEAITKLHYILTLKEIGFDLEKIKDVMTNQKTSPKELLHMRLEMITGEIQELEKSKRIIQGAIRLMEFGGHESWEEIFGTFKNTQLDKNTIVKNRNKFFTRDEQEVLSELPKINQNTAMVEKWVHLIKDIRKEMDRGTEPESVEGQKLGRRWSALVEGMYGGDWSLAQKAWNIHRSGENIGFVNFNEEIVTFIERAIAYSWDTVGDPSE